MLTAVKQKVRNVLEKTDVDNKIVSGVKHLRREYKKNLITAFSAALAFVMALYIRDLVKEWINWVLKFFEVSGGTGLIYQTVVAFIVLTMCVFGIVFLSKWKSEK